MKRLSGQAKNKQTEEIPDKFNCVLSRNRNQTSDKQSLLNQGENHNLFIIFWKFFIDDLFNISNTAKTQLSFNRYPNILLLQKNDT